VPDDNPCSRGRHCIPIKGKTCNGRRGSCEDNGCGCRTSVAARSRRLPDARLAGVDGGCCCGGKGCCRVAGPLTALVKQRKCAGDCGRPCHDGKSKCKDGLWGW